MSVKYLISWRPLRGLNSRPSAYKTTLKWRHASVPKLLAAPAHAAEGAGGQAGAGHRGAVGFDRTQFSFFALVPPEWGSFESLRVSVSVSKRRNGGFFAPVFASKICVPG